MINVVGSLLLIICSQLYFFACEDEVDLYLYGTPDLAQGRKAYRQGDMLKAYKLLKPLVTKYHSIDNPENQQAMALCALADCYVKQGSFTEVHRLLDHAYAMLGTTPEGWKVSLALGIAYTDEGKFQDGENHLLAAVKSCRQNKTMSVEGAVCLSKLGELYQRAGQNDKALKAFQDAMLQTLGTGVPMYYKAWANAAYCNAAAGDKQLAADGYEKLTENLTYSKDATSAKAKVLAQAIKNRIEILKEIGATDVVAKLESEQKEAETFTTSYVEPVVKDVDFRDYMHALQRRIKSKWHAPRSDNSKRIVVQFKVARNGDMSNLKITSSANQEKADAAAMQAVEKASPFAPLPEGAPESVDIQFTFDYNVFTGSGKGSFRQF
jgi:TonB family protein